MHFATVQQRKLARGCSCVWHHCTADDVRRCRCSWCVQLGPREVAHAYSHVCCLHHSPCLCDHGRWTRWEGFVFSLFLSTVSFFSVSVSPLQPLRLCSWDDFSLSDSCLLFLPVVPSQLWIFLSQREKRLCNIHGIYITKGKRDWKTAIFRLVPHSPGSTIQNDCLFFTTHRKQQCYSTIRNCNSLLFPPFLV